MNQTERQAAYNLAISNGNLMTAIAKDDLSEIIKALQFLEVAQLATGVTIYESEKLRAMSHTATIRLQARLDAMGVGGNG